MNSSNYVPLVRRFAPIPHTLDASTEDEFSLLLGSSKELLWNDLERKFRVVILADAGAGKTEEMISRATILRDQGFDAFFCRIEDLADDFGDSIEIGTAEEFSSWYDSVREGWFYLDSVDEARLRHPKDFRNAIRNFAKRVRDVGQRAHVIISSRPYGWQFQADRNLFESLLPFAPENAAETTSAKDGSATLQPTSQSPSSSINLYVLRPLAVEDIRCFAQARNTPDPARFLESLERANLVELASRPFDLEELIEKWKEDFRLGDRLELISKSIARRLDEISPDRDQLQPLDTESARNGARVLAATVTLTDFVGIDVPDSENRKKNGVDPKEVLSRWTPPELQSLLQRSLFSDPLFGVVRFRHREIRELLTAEWIQGLLQKGNSRREVESLIFRNRYGEEVITPRMRPILPWLILLDEPIRERVWRIQPEIAVEGGDPSSLPFAVRKAVLKEVVARIVSRTDDRSARNNDAIARIARSDLCNEVGHLIDTYYSNDDAIFFLARVVWQGHMSKCLSKLLPIALDPTRSLYPRLVAIRAISSLSSDAERYEFWEYLLDLPGPLVGEHVREIVEDAPASPESSELLLASIVKVAPANDNQPNGLGDAFFRFIDRFDLNEREQAQTLMDLVFELNKMLDRTPHLEEGDCQISKDYAWLIGPSGYAIGKFVTAKSDLAFSDSAISILQKISVIRFWYPDIIDDHSSQLNELIPAWPELNDMLFWRDVAKNRSENEKQDNKLISYYQLSWADHCWQFDISSFERVLNYVQAKESLDDQLVGLSLAFHLFSEAGKPQQMENQLVSVAMEAPELEAKLEELLHPILSEDDLRMMERNAEYKRKREQRRIEDENRFSAAVEEIKNNVESLRALNNKNPGELNSSQNLIIHQLWRSRSEATYSLGSDWRALESQYGEKVAIAFRDTSIAHWRRYNPVLRSEGSTPNSIPTALIFGLTGIAIEAEKENSFPKYLSVDEARFATRYALSEMNIFPSWFEKLHRFFPEETELEIWAELQWELENVSEGQGSHYVTQAIFYRAPWLHNEIASKLYIWLNNNNLGNSLYLRQCIQILNNSKITCHQLSNLAKTKSRSELNVENLAVWYAFWVNKDPQTGIFALERWLRELDTEEATHVAQIFITALMGAWTRVQVAIAQEGMLRDAAALGKLYRLMKEYIRVGEDIDRSGKGIYSPELRDDAQDARDRLLKHLSDLPGKKAYTALKQLSFDQEEGESGWIARLAFERARQDADVEAWSSERVRMFSEELQLIPSTHTQLYEVAVLHLLDLKDWLEFGNDSQAHIYQKAEDEADIRKLIAYWLRRKCQSRYTCAEESPLANDQRPDLWLQLQASEVSPVPIELKLLDKGWSGPKLCERLNNQLRGDYIREKGASSGIFLVVWQGKKTAQRRWRIDGKSVGLDQLEKALQDYWNSISAGFPEVDNIRCIVIDLTLRALKSQTSTSKDSSE